ncbi:hypothetical protein BJ165DRAFT_1520883 [Panaeolus papilionaceus]|nr:hypothetical protein BJ165DRAFT_1520883 [Panaeolus papilionaceus]
MDFRTGLELLAPYASALQKDVDLDVSNIKGNVSEDVKRLSIAVFRFFISDQGHSYGAAIGQRLKPLEINIFKDGYNGSLIAETVFEIQVENDMCNIFDSMHGACAAFIIDPCSSSSLVSHGLALGVDGTGVSQSMAIIWHHPIRK